MTTSAKASGLAFVALLAAAGYLVGLWRDSSILRLLAKPVPVLCLLVWVRGQADDRYARLVATGLGLSALGDILLEFPGLFVAGLGAFLCAHIAYIIAFLTEKARLHLARALPFLAWLGLAYANMHPGLGGMRVPVTIYVIVIGAMMWRAAARVGDVAGAMPAAIGAVLFGLSDTLIGLDRFHAPIPGARYAIGLLYWAGQTGLSQRRLGPEPVTR
jgi:alkenylglycerophosphocholine hydrolase